MSVNTTMISLSEHIIRAKQMAGFLLELYDSEKVVGLVDRRVSVSGWQTRCFPYAGNSSHNQQRM